MTYTILSLTTLFQKVINSTLLWTLSLYIAMMATATIVIAICIIFWSSYIQHILKNDMLFIKYSGHNIKKLIISRWLMSHHAICQDYIMISLVCVQIYMVCKVATCGIYTIDPIFWTIMIQVFALHISSLYVYINRKQGLIYVDDLLYICMANIVTSDYIHLLKA